MYVKALTTIGNAHIITSQDGPLIGCYCKRISQMAFIEMPDLNDKNSRSDNII